MHATSQTPARAKCTPRKHRAIPTQTLHQTPGSFPPEAFPNLLLAYLAPGRGGGGALLDAAADLMAERPDLVAGLGKVGLGGGVGCVCGGV